MPAPSPSHTTERFSAEPRPPWRKPAGLSALLAHWAEDPRVTRNLTLDERLPGRDARCVALPESLPRALVKALAARGIDELYCHQRAAYDAAVAGRDLVIATPTASGK